ncbi:ClpP class serine protease [Alkalibacillus flavidus]|uniref:ClpP class serine protease n=1 Tax=Alkalibacillus flavidus TaxID=546021 RepID=A0ABV2L0A9_9BACI
MRLKLLILISVCLLSSFEHVSPAASGIHTDITELSNYVSTMNSDDITFDLKMKVTLQTNELISYKEALDKQIKGNDLHKRDSIDESLSMVQLNEDRGQLIYQIRITSWNDSMTKHIKLLLNSRDLAPFFENGTVFTCFQAKFDGKIDSNLFLENLIQDFQIELNSHLEDDLLTVVSGYTDKLTQAIPHQTNKMNIQLAIRDEDDRGNTVTIGTPILIIEY